MKTKNEIIKAMKTAFDKAQALGNPNPMQAAYAVAEPNIANAVLEVAATKLQGIIDKGLPENDLHAKAIHDVTDIFTSTLRSMKVELP